MNINLSINHEQKVIQETNYQTIWIIKILNLKKGSCSMKTHKNLS